jgi:hypothetical protein
MPPKKKRTASFLGGGSIFMRSAIAQTYRLTTFHV